MNRVLILGIDGYIGWTLANYLLSQPDKYTVCGLDNLSRRALVHGIGSKSLTPISSAQERFEYLQDHYNFFDQVCKCNLQDHYITDKILSEYKPDTIVHLAEQPSAPYSMKDVRSSIETQSNNLIGTLSLLWAIHRNCPDAHLIKLGTLGEYGTPNCDIPEGKIPTNCLKGTLLPCPIGGLMFPRTAGSFYHLSKVHDTHNIEFACRNWGIRSTDIMQGIVYGLEPYPINLPVQRTRFDYDQYFGTVINRFCVQALCNMPLTIYGEGNQTRGYLPLSESIKCLTIAIDNPPDKGEYRTFNQFGKVYSINALARFVTLACYVIDIEVKISNIENPRESVESQDHYYNPACDNLKSLGYIPSTDIICEISKLVNSIRHYKESIIHSAIMPTTTWR
jgi:UDP-sulfoquinovose synthase